MIAKTTMMALLLGGVFVAASKQGTDHCTPVEVDRCYDRYSEPLWHPEYFSKSEDISNEDAFKEACRVLKAKDRCHLELANCPDDVKSSFKHQERVYEAVRDIVCEGTPLKDFKVAYFCTKPRQFQDCLIQRKQPVQQGDLRHPQMHYFCDIFQGEVNCYEQAFNSSCPLPLERAKAAFARAYDAMALLRGCKESSEVPSHPHA